MNYRTYSRPTTALVTVAAFVLLAGATVAVYGGSRMSQAPEFEISLGAAAQTAQAEPSAAADGSELVYRRLTSPDRTEVSRPDGTRVAIFTDGARTVHLFGAPRTFAEPRFTKAKVLLNHYVRLAPQPWAAGMEQQPDFASRLRAMLADTSPDILAVAMEYTFGAAVRKDAAGLQVAGDAAFGPLSDVDPDGRAENSDFYDYLGVAWNFPDGTKEKASATHIRSLDCSGFVRMVYGYRMGFPLLGTNTRGPGLPRRAYAIADMGPGVQLMPNRGTRARELDRLLPGDMVFFNAGPVQGANIEHMGMYLGVDDRGHHRFISSRSQANGPTMGDLAGESILDGTGYWALRLRTARRV